jgi:hypothetical protein
MKKYLLFAAVAAVAIAAAGYYFYAAPRAPEIPDATETALPAAPDADYTIVLKLTDMSSLRSFITGVDSLVSELQPDSALNFGQSLEVLDGMLDSITEMTIFAASKGEDNPVFYISLLADGEKFSSVMANQQNGFFLFEKWDSGISDSEGWTIKTPSEFTMYVLKRPGAEKSQILASVTQQDISDMISASDGKSPRFMPERTTSGVNFFQVRLKDGFTYGMLGEILADTSSLNPDIERLFPKDNEQVMFTVYEYSDTKDGNVVTVDSYTDTFIKNPGLAARHPKSAAAPKLMGDGELAYFLAFDTGFILSAIFPGAEDPAQEAFELLGVSPMLSGDLMSILSSARISLVCVVKDKLLNTAYMSMETDAAEALGKLYSMIGLLGLPSTEIQGWDSAVSTPPIPRLLPSGQNFVLAHGKGAFLAGMGAVDDFAKSPAVREEYKEFLSQDNILNGVVSSNLYDMMLEMAQTLPDFAPSGSQHEDETLALIAAIRDSFDFAGGKVSSSGKSYGKYALNERGNLMEAFFKIVSQASKGRQGAIID